MKKIEIIIRPGKLDDLRELLEVCEYHGIMITNIMVIRRESQISTCGVE